MKTWDFADDETNDDDELPFLLQPFHVEHRNLNLHRGMKAPRNFTLHRHQFVRVLNVIGRYCATTCKISCTVVPLEVRSFSLFFFQLPEVNCLVLDTT